MKTCVRGTSVVWRVPMHRLAARTLFHDRGRLAAAVIGVAVATMLMLVQKGIHDGFAHVASAPIRRIGGDIWLMSQETQHVDHGGILFPGAERLLRAHPCVTNVRPAIIKWTAYRRADGSVGMIQLFGVDLRTPAQNEHALPWNIERGLPADLLGPSRISIDALDASVLGPVDPIGARLEINGHANFVALVTRGLRADFGMHPRVFANIGTAQEILNIHSTQATFWIANLAAQECRGAVIGMLARDARVRVLTGVEFARSTERELLEKSGIGVALGFIALLGIIVAAAVVAQTLFAGLRQHRRELAMLKTIGATSRELVSFIAYQALALGTAGGLLGAGTTLAMRGVLDGLAVPVVVQLSTALQGFLMILVLCAVASVGSVRAVLRLETDEVLR